MKKKVSIMRKKEKKWKQTSLCSGINIKMGLYVAGLAGFAGLIAAFGASVSALAGIYLGYKLLRLVLRFTGLIVSLVFTFVSMIILVLIISLLIF
jgi:hypothetical protein